MLKRDGSLLSDCLFEVWTPAPVKLRITPTTRNTRKSKNKKKRETILKGKVDTLTLKLEKQKLLFIIYSPNENQTKKFTFDLNWIDLNLIDWWFSFVRYKNFVF